MGKEIVRLLLPLFSDWIKRAARSTYSVSANTPPSIQTTFFSLSLSANFFSILSHLHSRNFFCSFPDLILSSCSFVQCYRRNDSLNRVSDGGSSKTHPALLSLSSALRRTPFLSLNQSCHSCVDK